MSLHKFIFMQLIYFLRFVGDDILKKYSKILPWLLGISIVFMTGCGKKSVQEDNPQQTPKKDYDIFIYNSDTTVGKAFREMCDEYTKRTGVIIRTVTPSEDESTVENLESYMQSEYPPDIFTSHNLDEVNKWQSSENIWDFSNATEESFKTVVNDIPEGLRLSSDTSNSFGLPAKINAMGYIVDPKMIASIFGGDKYRKVLHDLKVCSYEEFMTFIDALSGYIENGSTAEFTLNEKPYSFVSDKGELSKKLTGVFSFAGGETKLLGSYLPNNILAAAFDTPAKANIANQSQIESISNLFMRYAEGLDLIANSVAGDDGIIPRGDDFVSSSKNSKTLAIKRFTGGKSLFLIGQTSDFTNMSVFDSLVAKRCDFIPAKMPISEIDIEGSSGDKIKSLQKALTIYSPLYYCINAKSSDNEKKAAQNFLVWLKTSDLAEKYLISEFGYVPYDLKDGNVLDNPLERSMIEYVSEKSYVPGVFMGLPLSLTENDLGKYIAENLLIKSLWSLEDYENLADFWSNKWKELKGI